MGVGSLPHLEAYWKEINHPTWEKTTEEFKEGTIQNIGYYILHIPHAFLKQKQDVWAKFQNKLRVEYDFSNVEYSPDLENEI